MALTEPGFLPENAHTNPFVLTLRIIGCQFLTGSVKMGFVGKRFRERSRPNGPEMLN